MLVANDGLVDVGPGVEKCEDIFVEHVRIFFVVTFRGTLARSPEWRDGGDGFLRSIGTALEQQFNGFVVTDKCREGEC